VRGFVVKDVRVLVAGNGCQGDLRLVGTPVEGGYRTGVSAGGLPGTTVVGKRLTTATSPRLAIVLTSSRTGLCHATQIRFGAQSWWRKRWTTVPIDFSISVTHHSGQDSRALLHRLRYRCC
jgi:hypothetical protein